MGMIISRQIFASLMILVFFLLCSIMAAPVELTDVPGMSILYSIGATLLSMIFILGEISNSQKVIKWRQVVGTLLFQLALLYSIADGIMFGFRKWQTIGSAVLVGLAIIISRAISYYRKVKENKLAKATARYR